MALPYPTIDPVALAVGPLAIRWYALAYITGILGAYFLALRLAARQNAGITKAHLEDFLFWAMLGIVLGGRLGYILLYQHAYYLQHPGEILRVWEGGMAFHGGLCGVIIAAVFFARKHHLPLLRLGDILACVAPLGLFLGRLANFVNGELYGRAASVPWAMVFPHGGDIPRHPSQLYEAASEGLLLFCILGYLAWKTNALQRPGALSGLFLGGYAVCRLAMEQFRAPDVQLGLYGGIASQGQLLSLPMLFAGLWLLQRARRPLAVRL